MVRPGRSSSRPRPRELRLRLFLGTCVASAELERDKPARHHHARPAAAAVAGSQGRRAGRHFAVREYFVTAAVEGLRQQVARKKMNASMAGPGKGRALGDGGVVEVLVALEVEGAEAEDALLGRLVQPPPRVQLRGRAGSLRLSCGAGMIAQGRLTSVCCMQRTSVSGQESGCAESLKSSKGYGEMPEKGSKACSAVMLHCIADIRLFRLNGGRLLPVDRFH